VHVTLRAVETCCWLITDFCRSMLIAVPSRSSVLTCVARDKAKGARRSGGSRAGSQVSSRQSD
jgi:hypothetical protein